MRKLPKLKAMISQKFVQSFIVDIHKDIRKAWGAEKNRRRELQKKVKVEKIKKKEETPQKETEEQIINSLNGFLEKFRKRLERQSEQKKEQSNQQRKNH